MEEFRSGSTWTFNWLKNENAFDASSYSDGFLFILQSA